MRTILFLTGLVLFSLSCILQVDCVRGHGEKMVQERHIEGFNAVSVAGVSKVVIKKDSVFSVKVYDYKDLLPHLQTILDDGELKIRYDFNCVDDTVSRVEITMPHLRAIKVLGSGDALVSGDFGDNQLFKATVSGSGDLWLNGDFGQNLTIKIIGSGDAYLNITDPVNELKVSSTGSGDIQITGDYARNLILTSLGSGDIYADSIMARTVRVKLSGSGDSKVYAVDSLIAKLLGSGDLCFKGNPQFASIQTSGSGEVIHCY